MAGLEGHAVGKFADGKHRECGDSQEFGNANMFANIPTWTTERVELLKQHFEAGLTCREIAAQIGVSRNAVIGKLTRLGLTRGPISAEQHLHATTKERAKSVPRAQYRMLQVVYENGEPAADGPIASERPCSLLELSKERCRWPISTPGDDGICFCGNTPLKGLPYCPGHTRLAYKPGSRQRMARA
jgi:GcrA cell cycle regulator